MKYYVFLFIFTLHFGYVYLECENVISVTDLVPENCDKSLKEYYVESVDGSCIPGCVKLLGLEEKCCLCKKCEPGLNYDFDSNKKCEIGLSDECILQKCAPGLKCELDSNNKCDSKCEIDPTSCARFKYMDPMPKFIPKCLPDGSYAPVQCKGEKANGRCFCYDPEGNRIFGEAWSNKVFNMTCACSRKRAELLRQNRNDVTLHCDSRGNYEPLQCDSGSCWCANPQTGEVEDSIVPESMMSLLPCYKREKVGSMYLRKCESHLIAQNKMREEFNLHGTTNLNLQYLTCDWDGSYGRLKAEKGIVYCIWRDGTNIGTWTEVQTKMKTVNCNCARDTKIYELANTKLTKQCSGNGNYEILQQYDETRFYCVDKDGFATTDPTEKLTAEICKQLYPWPE